MTDDIENFRTGALLAAGSLWVLLPFVIAFEHVLFWAIDHYPKENHESE